MFIGIYIFVFCNFTIFQTQFKKKIWAWGEARHLGPTSWRCSCLNPYFCSWTKKNFKKLIFKNVVNSLVKRLKLKIFIYLKNDIWLIKTHLFFHINCILIQLNVIVIYITWNENKKLIVYWFIVFMIIIDLLPFGLRAPTLPSKFNSAEINNPM